MSEPRFDTSTLDDLIARIEASEHTVGGVRLVCIDGPAGSGKTTLAADLAASLVPTHGDVPVVHGDDLYEGWDVVAGETDVVRAFRRLDARVVRWLVDPWCRGRDGGHPVYDWAARAWGPARSVPASASVVVLEGVGLAGDLLRRHAAVTVWVDADPAQRRRRVEQRDGAEVATHLDDWDDRERAWYASDGTRSACDVQLTTTDRSAPRASVPGHGHPSGAVRHG